MKDGKAAGIDEISSEAWKYGGKKVEGWLWRFYNRVWKGKRWSKK